LQRLLHRRSHDGCAHEGGKSVVNGRETSWNLRGICEIPGTQLNDLCVRYCTSMEPKLSLWQLSRIVTGTSQEPQYRSRAQEVRWLGSPVVYGTSIKQESSPHPLRNCATTSNIKIDRTWFSAEHGNVALSCYIWSEHHWLRFGGMKPDARVTLRQWV
jgi:hypothetical protein